MRALLVILALVLSSVSVTAQGSVPPIRKDLPKAEEKPATPPAQPEAQPEDPSQSRPDKPAAQAPAEGAVSQVRFFKAIQNQSNATFADAYRFAYILLMQRMGDAEASKAALTFEGYRDALRNANVICDQWADGATDLVTHQEVAYLNARAADIGGGVMFSLLCTTRYAHREMVDRLLMPSVNPRQYMSGPECFSAYRDCREFMRRRQNS